MEEAGAAADCLLIPLTQQGTVRIYRGSPLLYSRDESCNMAFRSLQSPLWSSPAACLALLCCTLLPGWAGSAWLTSDTICAGGSFSPQTGLQAGPSGSSAPPGNSSQQQANALPSRLLVGRGNGFVPSNSYDAVAKLTRY